MFKKLLLILSILSISAQNELNAISFKSMREGTSKQLGKAKNLCLKTGPRKAATLISVSLAFYTLLAAFHNKVHEFEDFWGTFFKQGTHPRKMYKLNGLRYDFLVTKRNLLEEVKKQLSEPRDEYIRAVEKHKIFFINPNTNEKFSILTRYNEMIAKNQDPTVAIFELYELAKGSIHSDIDQEVKTAAQKFKEKFESVMTATSSNDHQKSSKVYLSKKEEFTDLSKLPSCCCSSSKEEECD